MTYKNAFSFFWALLLGAIFGAIIKVGFALPGFLPTTDLFMFIVDSPLWKLARRIWGGEGGVMIAIAVRALTCSVLTGIIAGVVLQKIKFKRTFCYAALWFFLVDMGIVYLSLDAASGAISEKVLIIQKEVGRMVWTDVCVYGWYYLALYLSYAIASRMARHLIETRQAASQ